MERNNNELIKRIKNADTSPSIHLTGYSCFMFQLSNQFLVFNFVISEGTAGQKTCSTLRGCGDGLACFACDL